MKLEKLLYSVLGQKPSSRDYAQHIADSIGAQERLYRIAMGDGDPNQMDDHTKQISKLRSEAKKQGFDRYSHPGLFR